MDAKIAPQGVAIASEFAAIASPTQTKTHALNRLANRSQIIVGAAVFIVSVFATVALNFFLDDLATRVIGFATTGELGGKWDVRWIEYQRGVVSPEKIIISATATFRQLGSRVLVDLSTTQPPARNWTAEGYYNRPSLGIAYVTTKSGGSGLGTFTLHESGEGNDAFIGFTTGIECKARTKILLTCPIIFVRPGRTDLELQYKRHLNPDRCSEVPVDQICPVDTK